MLSDEEKKAIDYLQFCYSISTISNESLPKLGIVLNLIEKQSKEIEHQKEKRANQKKELAILNAKQIEFNKLVNTVNSYKGQFKRQEKEIEELKDKNKKLQDKAKELIFEKQELTSALLDSTLNDKIKAKIEEIDFMIKEINQGHLQKYTVGELLGTKRFLESLLEKE